MCLFKEIVYYILTLIVWRRPGGVTKGVKGGGGGGNITTGGLGSRTSSQKWVNILQHCVAIQKPLRRQNTTEERAGTLVNICKQGRMI